MSHSEDDFAAMFEASVAVKRFDRGEKVHGTVVAVGSEVALIDVGAKSEAEIDLVELQSEDGSLEFAVGDAIEAMVVSTGAVLRLSRRGVQNAATEREIENAFQDGLAVEGKVERAVKGGYEVRIARVRAFCPISQIDIARTEDPSVHEGKVYAFRVIEIKEGRKDVILSRRKLLEEEERARAVEVRKSIVPGAVLSGHIASIVDFGAFVDLGGAVQGLLHVSDMSWTRVSNPKAVVAVGDPITVQVLAVGDQGQRISLGLKQLQADPWTGAATRYAVGQAHSGRVTRVAEFGAFVELEPGIEALAHSSTFAPTGRADGWKDAVSEGATARFEVLSVEPERKRIGVAMIAEGAPRGEGGAASNDAIVPGAIVTGRVERHEPFGVFVFLAPGITGLIPTAETGLDRDRDLVRAYPVGSEVEVAVLEVDADGRRIRLSRKALEEQRERGELDAFARRQDGDRSESFGSLAEKLRGALGKDPGGKPPVPGT